MVLARVLILLPFLVALAMLNRMPAARVALKVYLPCMMLIPLYLQVPVGGLFFDPTTFVAVVLAVIGWYTWSSSLRLTALDGCALLFAVSAFISDVQRHDAKLAMYAFLTFFIAYVCPYVIGRTLIEQSGMRREFAKVFVLCLVAIAIVSPFEYLTVRNPFQEFVERVFHHWVAWPRQTRWGFARIAGPFGHAIVAGMVFSIGLLLQMWLVGTRSWNSRLLGSFRSRRKPLIITLAVLMGLFMTQSRGPWIGCTFGLIIAAIGFARNRRLAAILALSGLAVALTVTSIVLNKYTNIDDTKTTDRDQLNASYRRELIATYTPLIEEGGVWGWGTPQVVANGAIGYSRNQASIDNNYILVAMWQGYFGIGLLLLMYGLTLAHLIRLCATMRNRDDILFAYCMMGCVLATAFSSTTVSITNPMTQITFMLMGWSASIRPTGDRQEALAPVSTMPFAFKRVFA